jgi:hypothetical protein
MRARELHSHVVIYVGVTLMKKEFFYHSGIKFPSLWHSILEALTCHEIKNLLFIQFPSWQWLDIYVEYIFSITIYTAYNESEGAS